MFCSIMMKRGPLCNKCKEGRTCGSDTVLVNVTFKPASEMTYTVSSGALNSTQTV